MPQTDFTFMNDLQLAHSIEKSEHGAIEHLYDKYSAALYGIIFRIINKKELAEECLMATFKKACNEMDTYKCSHNSLFTWLSGIARRSAFLIIKEEQENPASLNNTNGNYPGYSAFELLYLNGVSLKETAQISGITIAELKKIIRTTLQNLIDKKTRE